MIFYLYNFDYRVRVNNKVPIYLPEPPNLVRLKVDFGCEIPKCIGEAVQWTGLNEKQVMEFCLGRAFFTTFSDGEKSFIRMTIETLEGVMTAQIGDYIIKGVTGEFYPCKPEIFEVTNDPAPYLNNK
jgi:hypothetical protein